MGRSGKVLRYEGIEVGRGKVLRCEGIEVGRSAEIGFIVCYLGVE